MINNYRTSETHTVQKVTTVGRKGVTTRWQTIETALIGKTQATVHRNKPEAMAAAGLAVHIPEEKLTRPKSDYDDQQKGYSRK